MEILLWQSLDQFLREANIKEEEADLHLPLAGHLAGKMIDITKVKETITSTSPLLTIANHQARDDS